MTQEWTTAAPGSLGFEPRQLAAIDGAFRRGRLRNLHGVVVVRHGTLVFERYLAGRDERWGSPLGDVTFGPDTLHDVRSVTKSIVSLLYGIARSEGQVPPIDRPLLQAFPEYADLGADPARVKILVEHALTMTMGTEWDETLPYTDPRNGERQMEEAPDRYRFTLDRPIVAAPGERWNYNGGTSALLARLIARGTGRPLLEFARERLFAPLGIGELEWIADTAGEPYAASGLRLRPRDLARIGQLVLQGGHWAGRQLVPEDWLRESIAPRVRVEPFVQYGYQWWSVTASFGDATMPWFGAFGNGGQRLIVVPDLALVVVVTAGNYNAPDNWRLPIAILTQFVLPSLVAAER
jgi:CubicO group peptidase (beta-lactamase class C family)